MLTNEYFSNRDANSTGVKKVKTMRTPRGVRPHARLGGISFNYQL